MSFDNFDADLLDIPPPSAGHNHPPEPLTPAQVTKTVAEAHVALTERCDQLVRGVADFLAKHPNIETEDQAAAATENMAMIGKALTMAEDQRDIAKRPYWEAGKAVDAWFKAVKLALETASKQIAAPATVHALRIKSERKEEARLAALVAAREADRIAQAAQEAADAAQPSADRLLDAALVASKVAEAAQAKASAKPATFSRTVGTYGSTSSLRQSYDVEVTDLAAVPREFFSLDMPALRRAVAAGAREIDGCRIYHVETLKARA